MFNMIQGLPSQIPSDTPDFFWGVLCFIIIGLVLFLAFGTKYIVTTTKDILNSALSTRHKQDAPFTKSVNSVVEELKKSRDNAKEERLELRRSIEATTQNVNILLELYGNSRHVISEKVREGNEEVMKEVNSLGVKVSDAVKKNDQHGDMLFDHNTRIKDLEEKS